MLFSRAPAPSLKGYSLHCIIFRTATDPACGSGSLLIRALAEVPFEISGYGQEKESSTAGLAKMNAVLHNKATIKIMAGNTFSDPQFIKNEDASELERFDYIVANPPFSLKNWSDGLKEFGRFSGYGDRPPEKNGDYAWLMHILKTTTLIHSFLLIKNSSFCTKFPKFMCASLRKNISLFLVYYKHFIKSTVFCRISVFLLVEIDARIGPLPCNTNWIIPPTSAAAMPGQTR